MTRRTAITAAADVDFERKHPRGGDGRFITVGGMVRFLDSLAGLWVRAKVLEISKDGKAKIERTDTKDQELIDPSRLYAAESAKATLDPSKFRKVGGQLGSNPGGTFEDTSGDKWYVKQPKSGLHARNEDVTNRLYRAAGVAAPVTGVSPDGKRFLTKIEASTPWQSYSGGNYASGSDKDRREKALSEIRKSFVVDAWLANWDAPLNDNLRVTADGTPLRVDAGGALMFRAQGGKRSLSTSMIELQSMRDSVVSPSGAQLYKGITKEEELDGARRVLAISPERIREMIYEADLPSTLADTMIGRRAKIAAVYKLKLPEETAEGQELLKRLAESDAELTDSERAEIAIKIRPLVPGEPVELEPGAPVWVQNKRGQKFSDIGFVNAIVYDRDSSVIVDTRVDAKLTRIQSQAKTNRVYQTKNNAQGETLGVQWANGAITSTDLEDELDEILGTPKKYEITAQSGRQTITAERDDFEVLRENRASPSARYRTGQLPQAGDKVKDKSGSEGLIVDVFPLYARVRYDDGEVKVARMSGMSLVDAYDPEKPDPLQQIVKVGRASVATKVGQLADVSGPIARFPLVAYSLPHRQTAIVLKSAPGGDKSIIMLANGDRATVSNSALYDPDTVDQAAVDALPVKGPAAAKGAAAPMSTAKLMALPPRDISPVKGGPLITLQPGDRIMKNKIYRGWQIWVLRKDGKLEGWDTSNRHMPSMKDQLASARFNAFMMAMAGGDLRDITPARYSSAATVLGAIDLSQDDDLKKYTPTWRMDDPAVPVAKRDSYSGKKTIASRHPIELEPGDEFIAIGGPTHGKKIGELTEWSGLKDVHAPMLLRRRNGKWYDAGYLHQSKVNDEGRWKPVPDSDILAIRELRKGYWYEGSSKPEPMMTMADGRVIKRTDYDAGATETQNLNNTSISATAAMNGSFKKDQVNLPSDAHDPLKATVIQMPYWLSYVQFSGPNPQYQPGGPATLRENLPSRIVNWNHDGQGGTPVQRYDDSPPWKMFENDGGTIEVLDRAAAKQLHGDQPKAPNASTAAMQDALYALDARSVAAVARDKDGKLLGVITYSNPKQSKKDGTLNVHEYATGTDTAARDALKRRVLLDAADQEVGITVPKKHAVIGLTGDKSNVWSDTKFNMPGRDVDAAMTADEVQDHDLGPKTIPVTDIRKLPGFDALSHVLPTSREQLAAGAYDEQFTQIYDAVYSQDTVSNRGRRVRNAAGVYTISDGTPHFDPYMAEFVLSVGGDQRAVVLPPAVFNAVKDETAEDLVYRGVTDAEFKKNLTEGPHFNGRGVYGNGTYTTTKAGTSGSYGQHKTAMMLKPGARAIDHSEVVASVVEDVNDAHEERWDLLHELTADRKVHGDDLIPSAKQLQDFMAKREKMTVKQRDAALGKITNLDDAEIAAARTLLSDDGSVAPLHSTESDDLAAMMAAIFKHRDYQVEKDSDYYRSDPHTFKVTRRMPNGDKIVSQFKIRPPMINTNVSRSRTIKSSKNVMPFVSGKVITDTAKVKKQDFIDTSNSTGHWRDDFTDALGALGFGSPEDDIADNTSEWLERWKKLRGLDARISFIVDPGRWTLASGFDAMSVPLYGGEIYYVMTHRSGLMFRR